jgi:hypothetical protein
VANNQTKHWGYTYRVVGLKAVRQSSDMQLLVIVPMIRKVGVGFVLSVDLDMLLAGFRACIKIHPIYLIYFLLWTMILLWILRQCSFGCQRQRVLVLGIPVQAALCLLTKAHLQVLVELGHSSTKLPLSIYLSLSTVIIQRTKA